MSEQLKILISGSLDITKTTTDINTQIKTLQSKIDTLKINFQIDDKVSKTLADFSKAMENHKKIAQELNRVTKEEKTVTKEADGTIKEKIKQHLKNGEIIEKEIVKVNNKTKAIKEETQATQQLIAELDRYGKKQKEISTQTVNGTTNTNKYKNGFTDTTVTTNKKGEVASIRTVENLDQQAKATQKVTEAQMKLTDQVKHLNKEQLITNASMGRLNKMINSAKSVEEIKKIEDAMKRLSQRQVNTNMLSDFQKRTRMDAQSLLSTVGKTTDKKALDQLLVSVERLTHSTPQLRRKMQELSLQFREISLGARDAARQSLTLADAFRQAMVKFPVWMGASTLFFGSIAAIRGAISVITEVDSKIVSLQKVMSEDTNFDKIMSSASDSAQKFAQSLTDVLSAYGEFARQGYKEADLVNLGEAGLVASNVGEISAQQASEYLTSTLIQWKKDSSEAMSIVDQFNNISNNYATTVEKLGQGHSRAAATAKSWGLDMHELNAVIGSVTAATKQSGTEIGNFIKNVLPRLTSQPAQDVLGSLGISMTDQEGNIKNAMQIYKEVGKEFVNMDKINKSIVAEGLAGKFHVTRMNILLEDLGSANSMYDQILDTSKNSDGSAMKENEKYMQSIQARINLMKVEFEELALAMGGAFLTEGFIQTLGVLNTFAKGLAGITNVVGGLPIIFGSVSMAVLLMSKNFRMAVVDTNVLRGSMAGLAITSKGLGIAFRTLLASTGVGLVFVGIGFAIEKLIGSMGKAREEQEKLARENKEIADSYKEGRDDVSRLVSEYEKLEKVIASGIYDTTDLERYAKIKNELGQLMPSLVTGEDQYGNSIIGSSEYIKAKTDLLEKQLVIQEKINAAQKTQEVQDGYDSSIKSMKNAQKEFDNFFVNQSAIVGTSIEELTKNIARLEEKQADGGLNFFEKNELKSLTNTFNEYESLKNQIDSTKIAHQKATMDLIDNTIKLDDKTSQSVKSMINDFTLFAATSEQSQGKINGVFEDVLGKLKTDDSFKKTLESYSTAIADYNEKLGQGLSGDQLEQYQVKAQNAFESVKNKLIELAQSNGFSKDASNKLAAQLDMSANSAINLDNAVASLAKSTGRSKEELMAELALVSDGTEVMTDYASSIDGVTEAQEEQLTAAERATGLRENDITTTRELMAIYQALNGVENLSAAQKKELANATEGLAKMYPALVDGKKLNIDLIGKEMEQNDILMKSVDALADGHLNAEQQMTLATAINAKARLRIMAELADTYAKTAQRLNDLNVDDGDRDSINAWKFGKEAQETQGSLREEIEAMIPQMDQYAASLSDAIDYNGQYYKSAENAKKATEKNVYVSDKYKLELEAINTQLSQLQNTKSKYPQHSRQYRDALTKEIKLLKEQASIYASQQKDLKGQISSGNFKQYGNTTASSSSTGNIATSTSGSYGGKYASYVNEAAKKYGVNPFLIAAIIQQESNFNPNARSHAGAQGLMQLMPGTARGLGVKNSYDPYQNIMGGTKYIAEQLKAFGGDITKALAAYNAGPGNVKKYGGIPPFKETQNYVNKVTDSFKNMAGTVSNVSTAVSTASNSIADYYTNNFRVTSKFGQQESFRSSPHKGVDFANGRQGDPVKAIKGGKVITAAYSKTAGYWVVIQQDDGKVAKYMHLQKGLNVKAGQTVSSGAQLGKVGNTGRSTGAHLHLQIESNGKAIDPMAYLKTVQTSSSAVASGTEALDNAQMELLQSQQNSAQVSEQIQALYFELVNSRLSEYQRERDLLNDNVAIYERGMTIYQKGSKDWITMQNKRQSVLGKQMYMQTQEIKYLKENIKWNENLSAAQKAQLVDNLTAANEAYYQTRIEFQELIMEVINATTESYQRERQLLEDNIAVYERGMSVYRLGSAEWLKMQAQKNSMMGKQMVLYTKEIEYIKKQMATNKSLTKQQRADLQDMLTETTQAYYQMRVQFQELQMEKINAVVERYSREQQLLSDNLAISQYVAGKEKELSDEWIKSMQDRKDLTKQQMEYQWTTVKYLQGQLKTNKSITKEQRQQIEIMLGDAKTAYYSLRDQYDSLNEEFITAQESLADEIVDLYKKAYEQQRDAQLAALDDEQEAFEKNHDDKMKMLDKELTKYEEIINKKLESLREEKETDDFNKGLTDRQTEIGELTSKRDALAMDDSREGKARLAEIEKELKEKQEELAEYLADRELQQREKSLTDMLEEKQKEVELERESLDEKLEAKQESLDKERERINKHFDNLLNDERAFQKIREQVMIGSFEGLSADLMKFAHQTRDNMKYIGDTVTQTFIDSISKVRNQLKDLQGEFKQKATVQKETGLFHGTNEGNLKFTRMLKKGESYSITGYSDMNGGMYRLGHASSNLWVKAKDVGLEFLGFSSGGYTGNGEGLAMLHEKEIVLNKSDTKNMLEAVKLIRPIANLIQKPYIPKIELPKLHTMQPNSSQTSISLSFGDVIVGTKNAADNLFKDINNRLSKSGVNIVL